MVPVLAWGDPLIIRSGATLKLGNADHPTALEHTFVTIEPGGVLELRGEVAIQVAGDITIAGQIVVDPSIRKLKAGSGIPGKDGESEAGTNGQNGGSGTNMVSGGVITLNLRAEGTVRISGSIDLRAELEGGDGARGGDGAFRPAYIGTQAGSGGGGGHGGFGPARVVINAHTIDLRPSGQILLDSLGRGGKGGDGGNGGLGGSLGITNTKRGGAAGSGGEGGTGGSGGYLTLGAAILRIEGQISLTGGEGGEGGMVGLPGDGGYGGDGGNQPGGNGGDAGNPDGSGPRGGRGGHGGAGGTLTIRATEQLVYTTKAKLDGGRSGKPGAGRPAGAARGGKGGSGNPPGHDGRASGPLLPGAEGLPGQDAIESLWTGFTPPYWTGPFICSIPFTDTDAEGVLRKGMELCGGHCMSVFFRAEAGAPLELRFEHRWRTATGALVVRFGGHVLYRTEAPGGVPAGFSEVREVFSDPVLFSPFLRPLEICVEPAEARIQIANFVIRRAPELNGPQLVIEGPVTGTGPIGFNWLALVGQTYQLQVRSSLTAGSWESVGSPVIGTGQSMNVSAPPPSSPGGVYYRLMASPVQ
ncbi:MAG: hypothetical protein J0L84_08765 [Verrucomicrobia bacterium]|nr:hypothetical protein [Verrucomicrobiota bacterium]